MRSLGLGVLGLGEGRSIVSAGLHSDLWHVAKLCDLNDKLGAERCAEFSLNSSVFTKSFDELLADPAVDVVGIYTPDQLHAEHVIRCLNAGKHVICTKPFLDNLGRGREVLEACRTSGKRVMVGQSSRFFGSFKRQREHFDTGAFGTLSTVEAAYHADHRWFLAKGWARLDTFKWLYGCISHPADLVRWYLPAITDVMGYAMLSENGKENGLAHPDTFHFVLKAADGRIARVSGSYTTPIVPPQRDSGMTCILRCNGGASQADYHELRYSYTLGANGTNVIETFEKDEEHFFRFGGRTHHAGEYQNYIEYFARCLEGGVPAKPDVEEGLVTMALMQAMEESYLSEKPVKIADVLRRYGLAELAS
jgi:predicted dehydrogenase